MKRYNFGVDVGTASLGLVVFEVDNNDLPINLAHMDTLIYREPITPDSELLNKARRDYRLQRRQLIRYKDRIRQIIHLYKLAGGNPKDLFVKDGSDIFKLRAQAIEKKLELHEIFRVFLHIAKNRGYAGDLKSDGKVKKAIEALKTNLANNNEQTLGQRYYKLQQEKQATREKFRVLNEVEGATGTFISRDLIKEEFNLILAEQQKHHPVFNKDYAEMGGNKKHFNPSCHEDITTFASSVQQALFFQRPIKWSKDTIGDCSLIKGEKVAPKASLIFQNYRIEKKLSDLTWKGSKQKLTNEEKEVIRELLENKEKVSFTEIYEALENSLKDNSYLAKKLTEDRESSSEGTLVGNRTRAYLTNNKHFKPLNLLENLTEDELEGLLSYWSLLSTTDELYQERKYIDHNLEAFCGVHNKTAKDNIYNVLLQLRENEGFDIMSRMKDLDAGRANYSSVALKILYNEIKLGKEEQKIIEEYQNKGQFHKKIIVPYKLESLDTFGIKNPIVLRSLKHLEDSLSYAIKKLEIGSKNKINKISVEVTREMKAAPSERAKLEADMKQKALLRGKYKKNLEDMNLLVNDRNVEKYILWEEQNKKCAYSGKVISIQEFFNCEIDHIIPRAKGGSNARYNKVLTFRKINNLKKDLTPWQACEARVEGVSLEHIEKLADEYKNRKDSKNSKEYKKKAELLLFKEDPSLSEDAMERAFAETSYIGKFLAGWLKPLVDTYDEVNNKEVHNINVTRGALTAFLRKHWGIETLLQELREEENKPLIGENSEFLCKILLQQAKEIDENNHLNYEEKQKAKQDLLKANDLKDEKSLVFYKRCDHRHHIIDAAVIALTSRSMIQKAQNHNKKGRGLNTKDVTLRYYHKTTGEVVKEFTIEAFKLELPYKNLRKDLKSKLLNYVVWHKPDRHVDYAFFQEGVYALAPMVKKTLEEKKNYLANIEQDVENKYLIKSVNLNSLGEKYEGVIDSFNKIVGKEIKESLLKQFKQRYAKLVELNAVNIDIDKTSEKNLVTWALLGAKKEELEKPDSLYQKLTKNYFDSNNGIFFPEHNKKNKVKKVKCYYKEGGYISYKVDKDYYDFASNSVRRNKGYSCAKLDYANKNSELLSNLQATKFLMEHAKNLTGKAKNAFIKKAQLPETQQVQFLYPNDLVYVASKKNFYVVASFSEDSGIKLKLTTEPFAFKVYKDSIHTTVLKRLKQDPSEKQTKYYGSLKATEYFKIVSWKNVLNEITIIKDRDHIMKYLAK